MLIPCRSGRERSAASLWPYHADAAYFRAMALLSGLCALAVFAVEAYAIWFVVFANDMSDRDKYGILGEQQPLLLAASPAWWSAFNYSKQQQQIGSVE